MIIQIWAEKKLNFRVKLTLRVSRIYFKMARAWKMEQDFYTKRDKLVVENELFQDDSFPCPAAQEGSPCMWVRPPTLINAPVFLKDVNQPETVQQGRMSCDSLPVVLDILQRRTHLWNYVVAQDQSFDRDYAGMFLFRFWRSGKMEPILVDDVLPFDVDSKTFMLSTLTNAPDIWSALMEKAYAKFLGGYDSLKTVTVSQAISDILNCTVQLYTISTMESKARLFKILKSVFDFDNIAIAKVQISPAATEVFRPEYLHSLYIITSMLQEQDENGEVQWVVTLWQPWIQPGIADTSAISVSANTFSVTLKEFTKIFAALYVGIPRFPNLFSIPNAVSHSWKTLTISGKWARCRKNDSELLSYPFARILVNKSDSYGESRLSTVVLSLMQCYDFPTNDLLEIGMVIYGLTGNERLQKNVPTSKLILSQPVAETEAYATREITLQLCLEPGQYLIVPETKDECICRSRSRYLLTLYSVEPIILMNGGFQKYGDEYLSPVTLTVSACKYVAVGQPIRVAAKITDFPTLTRYTMSVLLMLRRMSAQDPLETTIKARMEFVEVCQGLMDKELFMYVYYHEYVKFPLQGEEFIARCSAFIHELSLEVNAHAVVTTVLPKVKMAIDRNVITEKPTMVTAMLHNTLPLSIPSARFRVLCSFGSNSMWITGSPYEIPPFGTIWIVCRLKATEPRCHKVKVYFLSDTFKRSASLSVQAQDSAGFMLDECPATTTLRLLGQKNSLKAEYRDLHMVSCCLKHNQVKLAPALNSCSSIKPSWYAIDKEFKPTEVVEEFPEEIFCCMPDLMRDVTPEAELPSALADNESETQDV